MYAGGKTHKGRTFIVYAGFWLWLLTLSSIEALVISKRLVQDDSMMRESLAAKAMLNETAVNITSTSASDPTNVSLPNTTTTTTTTTTTRLSDLPRNWELFCTTSERFVGWDFTTLSDHDVARMLQISCRVNNDNHLYLSDFRIWQGARSSKDPKVAIKVVCDESSGGSFHAPWPLKEMNLVFVEIRNCRLPDYYSEYYDERVKEFPDQLRVLEIRNCTPVISVVEVFALAQNISQTFSEVDCGSVTLEKLAFSQFQWDFEFGDYFGDYSEEDMSEDEINSISDDLWQNSRRLRVYCDYQHLRYIEESWVFSRVHLYSTEHKSSFESLLVYNLSNIGLDTVPKEFLNWRGEIMRRLQVLDLSHNNISDINFYGSGDINDGIGRIDLRYNNISMLSMSDLRSLKALKSAVIDLRHNPINCSCYVLTDLYEFLKEPDLGPYEYLRELKCVTPPALAGRMVGDMSEAEIHCKEPFYVLIAVLSVCTFALICTIVILVRYRREVVILVYTRLHIVLPCQPVENCDSKEYDAFISYSSKDDSWVLQTLVKELENSDNGPRLKLCVHHRDFELGAAIAENVVRSVESSRHTIMVVSSNYIESEWCIYEFRTALYQSLLEKRKHLIVVILEKVPKSNMDPDLRKCIETFTYIEAGDKLFWDKMVYTLTIGTKKRSFRVPSSSQDPSEEVALKSPTQCNNNTSIVEKV